MFYINKERGKDPRYDFDKFMNFESGCFDSLTSFFLHKLSELPVQGEFVVDRNAYRPEMISNRIYRTVHLWKVLLAYNNIIECEELEIGTELVFPSLQDLEKLYFQLQTLKQAQRASV